jgi:hypothetical protein
MIVNALPSAILGFANISTGIVTRLANSANAGTWTSGNMSIATADRLQQSVCTDGQPILPIHCVLAV